MAYKHFTLQQRERLCELLTQGAAQSQIAKLPGQSRGTISREIYRNSIAAFITQRDRQLPRVLVNPQIHHRLDPVIKGYWTPNPLPTEGTDQLEQQLSFMKITGRTEVCN